MPSFKIVGYASGVATVEVEAETKEQAIELAENHFNDFCLCLHCQETIELEDIHDLEIDEYG